MATSKTPLIRWQPPMLRMLGALAPLALAGVYFFGWRAAVLLALCNALAFVTEYLFVRTNKEPVTSAAFVTGTLFALALPPTLPYGMAALGIVFGITFGKMVYGGFGRNVFNPALVGRAFIYVCFGAFMTGAVWSEPAAAPWGGLVQYLPDAVTGATPGVLMKAGRAGEVSLLSLVLGNVAGTIGGTSALLALLGGLYLCFTKTANFRIPLAGLVTACVVAGALHLGGVSKAADPLREILASNMIFGLFYFATEPVSAPKTQEARWLYGAFIGAMAILITVFSAWPAGTMFAILLANMFAPITDHAVKAVKARGKAPAKA